MSIYNYGHRSPSTRPTSSYSPQFSSTPSNPTRFIMSRFGYSSIPSYPRPRSSASKPNPDSDDMDLVMDDDMPRLEYPTDKDSTRSQFRNSSSNMDSMRNNFGSPNAHIGDSFLPKDSLYSDNDSFQSPNSSAYYSCNDTFSELTSFLPRTPVTNQPTLTNEFSSFKNQNLKSEFDIRNGSAARFLSQSTSFLSRTPVTNQPTFTNQFSSFKNQNQKSVFGIKNGNAARFQKKSNQNFEHSSTGKAKNYFPKRINPIKKRMATKEEFRCTLCSIDFTSSVPFEMHLRGAKHAKKVKTQDVFKSIQKQVAESKDIASVGDSFRCELCNVHANGSLQFQTHLDGTKHKNKVLQMNQPKEKKEEAKAVTEATQVNEKIAQSKDIVSIGNTFHCELCNVHANGSLQFQTHLDGTKHKNKVLQMNQSKEKKELAKAVAEATQVNGKSNGSTVRTLPAEFGEPQPSKLAKYSCDICGIIVNSETQLEQHLSSKNHKANVEGKPLQKKKTQKKPETQEPMEEAAGNAGDASEAPKADQEAKTIVGVKSLSSSFVAGETLQ